MIQHFVSQHAAPLTVTTQYARERVSDTIQQNWKSRFPAYYVKRCNEAVATATIFRDTPASDSVAKAAQLFIGWTSLVAGVYGIKTDKEFVTDCDRADTSTCINNILRALVISDWQSEPYQQNQII
jgi:hypothetical protein